MLPLYNNIFIICCQLILHTKYAFLKNFYDTILRQIFLASH